MDGKKDAIVALSDLRRGRGGGEGYTPLYKSYRYVPPQTGRVFSPFGLITGIDFAHFGLESEFPGVPHPREQVTGWYTILLSLSFKTQFNNDNTV